MGNKMNKWRKQSAGLLKHMLIHSQLMQNKRINLRINELSPRSHLHSLSAFKSSSKFSDDFIFHLPEKSGIVFSIVIERRNGRLVLGGVYCRQSHRARSLSPASRCASFSLRQPMCTALSSACICASIDWLRAGQAVMVVARAGRDFPP